MTIVLNKRVMDGDKENALLRRDGDHRSTRKIFVFQLTIIDVKT